MRALAAIATALPTDDSAWGAALAAERAAFQTSDRFYDANVRPAVASHNAGSGSFDAVVEQEEAWSPYNSAHADAINALILTPAPSLEAVTHKLRLGIEHWVFDGSSQSLEMVSVIADDIDRLGGRA